MEARELTQALGGTWRDRHGVARCPVEGHGRGRGDKNPSLSVSTGHTRPVVFHCHAGCPQEAVINALRELGAWPPGDEQNVRRPRNTALQKPPTAPEKLLDQQWRDGLTITGTIAADYLTKRNIEGGYGSLRFAPEAVHPISGIQMPALMAALRSDDGTVHAIQLTYLTSEGSKAAVKPARLNCGSLGNGAVQLASPGSCLGLAEGVETALSAMTLFDVPVWATCGLRFDKIAIPGCVNELILFADNDRPGLEHAETAKVHLETRGYTVEIRAPETRGLDWNDVLITRAIGNRDD